MYIYIYIYIYIERERHIQYYYYYHYFYYYNTRLRSLFAKPYNLFGKGSLSSVGQSPPVQWAPSHSLDPLLLSVQSFLSLPSPLPLLFVSQNTVVHVTVACECPYMCLSARLCLRVHVCMCACVVCRVCM